MTTKNLRIAVRLSRQDMDKFEALQAHFGESQAGTFRALLSVKTDQERMLKRAEKHAQELHDLNSKVDELSSWLKSRVE